MTETRDSTQEGRRIAKGHWATLALLLSAVTLSAWLVSCGAQNFPSSVPNFSTPSPTPNATITPLAAGSIAFTGWARNGSNQFAFVANSPIGAGVTLYFTTLSWDSTYGQFSDQSQVADVTTGALPPGPVTEVEGIISYVVPGGGLSADTAVIIGENRPTTIQDDLQGGAVSPVALFANTSPSGTALTTSASAAATAASSMNYLLTQYANGGHIFAYTVPPGTAPSAANKYFPAGSVFTTALIFGPDPFTAGSPVYYFDSALPPGLTPGTNAVDLSGLYTHIPTVVPTSYATAVAGGNNIDALASGPVCPTGSGLYTNTNWDGTILGHGHLDLYPENTSNSGVTLCANQTGFGFTTPTVTPIPY